jgi:hypothetical protein
MERSVNKVFIVVLLIFLAGENVFGIPTFAEDAGVTFEFSGASNSTERAIPAADAVVLAVALTFGTGDTIAATIAGIPPVESFQDQDGAFYRMYIAVFVGVPSGNQVVEITGADAGDNLAAAYRGINGINTTDPFDSPDVIAGVTTMNIPTYSDSLAFGVAYVNNTPNLAPDSGNTEVWESPNLNSTAAISRPGTGDVVTVSWSGGGAKFSMIGVNLLNEVIPPAVGQGFVFPGTGEMSVLPGFGNVNIQ